MEALDIFASDILNFRNSFACNQICVAFHKGLNDFSLASFEVMLDHLSFFMADYDDEEVGGDAPVDNRVVGVTEQLILN